MPDQQGAAHGPLFITHARQGAPNSCRQKNADLRRRQQARRSRPRHCSTPTVQPKNVTFPTDAKLLNRAREKLVKLAKNLDVELRQSYTRVGKFELIRHQRYALARQFNRANRALRKLKTYLGRIIRDITRKIEDFYGASS